MMRLESERASECEREGERQKKRERERKREKETKEPRIYIIGAAYHCHGFLYSINYSIV